MPGLGSVIVGAFMSLGLVPGSTTVGTEALAC